LDNWAMWAIDADRNLLDNGSTVQTSNWADFDCLGVDGNAVYVTANMFNNSDVFQYSKVWVVPKAQLLSGTDNLTWTEFVDPPGSSAVMQPAHTFGSAPAEYVITENFLINGAPPRRLIEVAGITFPSGSPVYTDLGFVEVATYPASPLPLAPQRDDVRRIDTGDTRLLNVVYRNGSLWTTHTVGNSANSRTEAAWYQVNPAAARTSPPYGTPVQQGRVADGSRFYYYPSIAVNAGGDVAMGFSGSSPGEYVGGFFTARAASDNAGMMQAVVPLKEGEASYYKILRGTDNRWGDYSATVVDPSDDTSFWTLQEYAKAPSSTWATWWGLIGAPSPGLPPRAPSALSAASSSPTQVNLSWTDGSSDETGFVIERRSGSGAYAQVGATGADVPSFSDNTVSGNTPYTYRVYATGTGGNSAHSNEATITTPSAPSPASGGGGGGCAAAPGSGDASSGAFTLLALLSPLVALAVRRAKRGARRTVGER
jgi:hypothetical protein